jgi:hypothetical protein
VESNRTMWGSVKTSTLRWVHIAVVGVVASHIVVRCASVGHKGGSVGWDAIRDWRKRTMTSVVVRFPDAPHGPSTSWVPPGVSPSPNSPSNLCRTTINRPHPSGEGRGGCGWDPYCGCWGAGALVVKPTSLRRGQELMAGLLCVVGRKWSYRGRWWWWRNEPKSTVMRLMLALNSARPSR